MKNSLPKTTYVVFALVASLILTGHATGGEARHGEAVNVFHCTFGEDWDVNYDGWPDRWIRQTGPDYPHYVNIQIHDDDSAPNKKCLRIDLDGAAAAVASPPIRVLPRFRYQLEAELKTEGLEQSSVVALLQFCDAKGRVLQTKRGKSFKVTKGWESIELESVEPSDPAIDRVVLTFVVDRSSKGDLQGRVSLADVRLARLPRIAVSTNNPSNVYTQLDGVVVQCELSGILERDPEIRFQLYDVADNELQSEHFRLDGRLIPTDSARGSNVADRSSQEPAGYQGTKEWRPNIPDYGYYRLVVSMFSSESADSRSEDERELDRRTIYLAVVPPLPMPKRGEFGWTLPSGDRPLSFQDLSRLLPQVGINWVKAPVWFDAANSRRGDELIRFVELLGASNIDVVGIIDHPPPGSELASRVSRDIPIAELLTADSTAWTAALEPVMTRLALRVRWWQLGRDGDVSFVGFPDLNKRIEKLRTALFRFGQDVHIGMSWDWTSPELPGTVSWDFEQLCQEKPPSEKQFNEQLEQPVENSARRWITVVPPARSADAANPGEAALLARSSDFVRRLVSAKVEGADAIIVSDPFNDENGLMRASGMPAELLLPWRTTAVMLGGAEYLGEMRLPNGSSNRIFVRPDGSVVMVVWNEEPTDETLYLGDDVRQYDVFGRSTKPTQEDREQVIHVDATPSFVLGLDEAITRWRMAVSFDKRQVPSIFGKPHSNGLRFHNYFSQGVGGTFRIVVLEKRRGDEQAANDDKAAESAGFSLDRWTIEPPQANFQLGPDEEMQFPFAIKLKNALFGKQPVRIDFKIEADEEIVFSAYQELEVGTEDLTLQVHSHLEKDTLIIEQFMTNHDGRPADFKCYLLAKGHRPQRMQVYRLGTNVDRKVYRFPNGSDLIGKEMLLEIEELNGPRALKYRFVAKDEPPQTESAKQPAKKTDDVKLTTSPQDEAVAERRS